MDSHHDPILLDHRSRRWKLASAICPAVRPGGYTSARAYPADGAYTDTGPHTDAGVNPDANAYMDPRTHADVGVHSDAVVHRLKIGDLMHPYVASIKTLLEQNANPSQA